MVLGHGQQEIWIFRVELQFIDGISVTHKMSVKAWVRRYLSRYEMNLTPDAVHAGEAEDPDDSPAASSGQHGAASLTVPAPGCPGGEMCVSLTIQIIYQIY